MEDIKISEEQIKREFLNLYKAFKKMKLEDVESPRVFFDVSKLAQDTILRDFNSNSRKYTKEQIRRFLASPENYERELREVSNYLYHISQEYKNLINFLSKMLTHDYILIPDANFIDKLDDKLIKNFYKTLNFLENYNIKAKLSAIEPILLREDLYFAYERTDGTNFLWQQLPTNYCRIAGLDAFDTYIIEFDFSYFNKSNVNIDNYDDEFKNLYNYYKSDYRKYRWQKLNPEKTICFKLDRSVPYCLPLFSGIFDEVLGLENTKDLQETNNKANNYKILHQKVPMKTDNDAEPNEFLIDGDNARAFHNILKSVVPDGIGVATTPMDINAITLKNNQYEEDIVSKVERNLFTSAGISQLIFSDENNGKIGLDRSIEFGSSIMFSLLRQYELWFKKRLRIFGNKIYNWKLAFPNITIYNQKQMFDRLLKAGEFGYSKFFIGASLGISQAELIEIMNLENKQLELLDNLIPLISAHTQSNNPGRPLKDDDLSDKGIEQRNREDNNNKS
jgi:hypothetical protein